MYTNPWVCLDSTRRKVRYWRDSRIWNWHCFLQVAATEWGVKYMEQACTVSMADEEATPDSQDAILFNWQSMKTNYDMDSCEFSVHKDIENLPPVRTCSLMATLLNAIASSVCDLHVDWMYNQEEQDDPWVLKAFVYRTEYRMKGNLLECPFAIVTY